MFWSVAAFSSFFQLYLQGVFLMLACAIIHKVADGQTWSFQLQLCNYIHVSCNAVFSHAKTYFWNWSPYKTCVTVPLVCVPVPQNLLCLKATLESWNVCPPPTTPPYIKLILWETLLWGTLWQSDFQWLSLHHTTAMNVVCKNIFLVLKQFLVLRRYWVCVWCIGIIFSLYLWYKYNTHVLMTRINENCHQPLGVWVTTIVQTCRGYDMSSSFISHQTNCVKPWQSFKIIHGTSWFA